MKNSSRPTRWKPVGIGLVLLAILAIHYAIIVLGLLHLSGDEAQYWTWSRHLAWGYYTKAPIIAWIIALGTRIAGNTDLGVRFFAPLFAFALTAMAYVFARQIHGSYRAGAVAALLFALTPIFFLGGQVMTTDIPMVTCWFLALWAVWWALVRDRPWAWYAAGLAVGLGLLSKYNMGVLPMAILVYLLLSRHWRRTLTSPHPWLAALLAFAVISPNLWWNSHHHWVTMEATWGNVTGGRGGWEHWLTFLAGQAGVVSPVLFALIFAALAMRGRRLTPQMGILVWPSLLALTFYLQKAWTGQVDVNWPVASYVGLFLWAAGPLSERVWARWTAAGLALSVLLIGLVLSANLLHRAHVPLPTRWYVPFKQMRGWSEIAAAVDRAGRGLAPYFVVTDFYQVSATLNFYLAGQPFVYYQSFGPRPALGNQYALWPGYAGRRGQNAILVLCGDIGHIPTSWRAHFASCRQPVFFTARSEGVNWHRMTLVVCEDYQGP
ncbi:MAG: glycosyltransferase family 39 protein [Acidithiobacillus sp.]|nr:glycosyltransferase family 39 protein [Acidithiobacillus sp.]